MKDALYIEVFNDPEKGLALFKQLETDYPDTPTAKEIAQAIPQLEAQVKAEAASLAIQRTLVPGAAFPDFSVKGLNGEDLSVAKYKGKVVLVDFWATWCGPCVEEMPNVIAAYNKFHDKGFEIIGVSLDQENDKPKVVDFTKQNKMPWPQFYDGKYWQNELAVKYGVMAIPTNFLIDPTGKILGVEFARRGAVRSRRQGAADEIGWGESFLLAQRAEVFTLVLSPLSGHPLEHWGGERFFRAGLAQW